jgi:hypothetical protein
VLGDPIAEIAEVTAQLLEREGKAEDPFHLVDAQASQGARLAKSGHEVTKRQQSLVDGPERRRRSAPSDGRSGTR